MLGLAVVLAVRAHMGSFGWAGATMAAFGAGAAAGGVAQARWIDRSRQTPSLVGCGLAHPAALGGLVLAAADRVPPALLAAAALAGATAPQLSPCMRALWAGLLPGGAALRAAFALEAVVVEAVFLVGPALVAGLLTVLAPAAVVLVAAGMSAAGTLAFAASAASRAWRGRRPVASLAGPLSSAGMRTLLGATLLFGAGDGALQLALPAYAVGHGSASLAGLLLTALAAGSVLGGMLYGARRWPGRSPARLVALQFAYAGGLALAALAAGPGVLLPLLLFAGLFVAPLATEGSLLVDATAPAGTVTEAFAWLITAVIAGGAVGTAFAGPLVERRGAGPAMLAAAGTLVAAGLVTRLRLGSLRPGR
jgi:hypothetical protein